MLKKTDFTAFITVKEDAGLRDTCEAIRLVAGLWGIEGGIVYPSEVRDDVTGELVAVNYYFGGE